MIGTSRLKQQISTFVPTPLVTAARYPRESAFVRGWTRFDKPAPSVLFFTTQKCASTLMRRMLALLNKRALHLTHLNLEAYFWNAAGDEAVEECLSRDAERYFQDNGILYAPLRNYVDISHLSRARTLAMLRDPRDILVSAFYSTAYIHRPPSHPRRRKAFLANRERVRNIGLEGHVRARAPVLADRFERYRQHIPRDRVLTYEQMWWDFPSFIRRLTNLVGVDLDGTLARELEALADVGDERPERKGTVRRKGTPGDHRDKLPAALVDEITYMFSDSLDWLHATPAAQGNRAKPAHPKDRY